MLAGRVFGPGFGFVLGATSLFASALLTGGVGPWLPFQMLGAAWVGLGAGLLPRRAGPGRDRAARALRRVSALLYGFAAEPVVLAVRGSALGNRLSFVPGDPARSRTCTASCCSPWPPRSAGTPAAAVTNVVLIAARRPAVLAALRRAARRAAFDAPVRFDP